MVYEVVAGTNPSQNHVIQLIRENRLNKKMEGAMMRHGKV